MRIYNFFCYFLIKINTHQKINKQSSSSPSFSSVIEEKLNRVKIIRKKKKLNKSKQLKKKIFIWCLSSKKFFFNFVYQFIYLFAIQICNRGKEFFNFV